MNIGSILLFTINAILPLILLILLGYFLKRIGMLSKEFLKVGNKLVFRVCLPVLLFCNITELESIKDIPWHAVIYVLVVIVLLILLGFMASLTTKDSKQKGVMMQCIFRSNFALIGIPLAELIGGSEGVTVAAILSVFSIPIYNIVAVIVLSVFVGEKSDKKIGNQIKNIAKNPLIIGVFLGIIVLLFKQALHDSTVINVVTELSFIKTTLSYISRMATPLALTVLGGQFEFESVKGYRKQIIIATVGRTIIAPLIGIGVAGVLIKTEILYFSPATIAAFIALFATPVAVASAIMADEMKNDGQLAAQLVVWTSLVSIFTLFVFIFVSRAVGII